MVTRAALLLGFSLAFVAGTLVIAQHFAAAQAPNAPAIAAPVPPADVPSATPAPLPPAPLPSAPAVSAPLPPAPVVETPAPIAPVPAPALSATPPSPPTEAAAAAPIVDPPLPQKRPVVSQETIPARVLFAKEELPSIGKAAAIGYYPRGCLQGGVELPIDGATWQVMRLSRNRNWGHPSLINFLERFAPLAAKATGWNGILIGDLAQPRGGPAPFGHRSHQTGLDVDIWFVPMPDHRMTKKERDTLSANNLVADDWKQINPKVWTPAHAAFIRTAAEQPEVERVLVNAAIKKKLCEMQGAKHPAWMKKVRPWYGHHDHIHVRLECPAGSPQCRPQPDVPGDDGCGKADLAFWFSDKVLHPKPKKGGKPPKPMVLADLPPACKTVLDAPAKKINAADSN
jgi:penicillin-insensitive murein endopeptidase